jgi:signal transduction histidine kinase
VYALAAAGVALAGAVLPAKALDPTHSVPETLFGGVSGLLFLGAGAVAHRRRPENRVGLLMVLVGIGWFAEDLRFIPLAVTYTAGLLFSGASSGFITHLVLTFPEGRLATRAERWLVGAAYATAFGLVPVGATFLDPGTYGQTDPPNLLMIYPSLSMLTIFGRLSVGIGAAVGAGVVIVLVRRWLTASAPRRRILAPVLITSLVGGLASMAGNALGDTELTFLVLLPLYRVAFCLLPLAFLVGVLRVRLSRTAVTALLADLRRPLSTSELRHRLATALGDHSLQIGYWRPEAEQLVDTAGAALDLPTSGSGRVVTFVDQGGHRVAGLIHDAALREDRHLLGAVSAAAGLTLDNQRLTAEVQAQLAEVRASRARIVAAVTEERRRMERDLHDGVQQGLVAAAIAVRVITQRLGPAGDADVAALLRVCGEGIDTALADLRALAHGIHPAILTEDGLVAALESLVERAPVAIELTAGVVPRLPAAVEATAYLVVAEALTNAMKHANADRIRVVVSEEEERVRVEVADDGSGGADASGSGLLGLTDRVRALGGDLTVRSGPGLGTSVSAVLPWSGQ